MPKPKQTKADLKRRVMELQAQLPSAHYTTSYGLDKVTNEKLVASAVVLEISVLGGREIGAVAISGGLSPETIKCLQKDIKRSFDLITEMRPKDVE